MEAKIPVSRRSVFLLALLASIFYELRGCGQVALARAMLADLQNGHGCGNATQYVWPAAYVLLSAAVAAASYMYCISMHLWQKEYRGLNCNYSTMNDKKSQHCSNSGRQQYTTLAPSVHAMIHG